MPNRDSLFGRHGLQCPTILFLRQGIQAIKPLTGADAPCYQNDGVVG